MEDEKANSKEPEIIEIDCENATNQKMSSCSLSDIINETILMPSCPEISEILFSEQELSEAIDIDYNSLSITADDVQGTLSKTLSSKAQEKTHAQHSVPTILFRGNPIIEQDDSSFFKIDSVSSSSMANGKDEAHASSGAIEVSFGSSIVSSKQTESFSIGDLLTSSYEGFAVHEMNPWNEFKISSSSTHQNIEFSSDFDEVIPTIESIKRKTSKDTLPESAIPANFEKDTNSMNGSRSLAFKDRVQPKWKPKKCIKKKKHQVMKSLVNKAVKNSIASNNNISTTTLNISNCNDQIIFDSAMSKSKQKCIKTVGFGARRCNFPDGKHIVRINIPDHKSNLSETDKKVNETGTNVNVNNEETAYNIPKDFILHDVLHHDRSLYENMEMNDSDELDVVSFDISHHKETLVKLRMDRMNPAISALEKKYNGRHVNRKLKMDTEDASTLTVIMNINHEVEKATRNLPHQSFVPNTDPKLAVLGNVKKNELPDDILKALRFSFLHDPYPDKTYFGRMANSIGRPWKFVMDWFMEAKAALKSIGLIARPKAMTECEYCSETVKVPAGRHLFSTSHLKNILGKYYIADLPETEKKLFWEKEKQLLPLNTKKEISAAAKYSCCPKSVKMKRALIPCKSALEGNIGPNAPPDIEENKALPILRENKPTDNQEVKAENIKEECDSELARSVQPDNLGILPKIEGYLSAMNDNVNKEIADKNLRNLSNASGVSNSDLKEKKVGYQCPHCFLIFVDEWYLMRHSLTHQKYTCSHCPEKFHNETVLCHHLLNHLFPSRNALKAAKSLCPVCRKSVCGCVQFREDIGRVFKTASSLPNMTRKRFDPFSNEHLKISLDTYNNSMATHRQSSGFFFRRKHVDRKFKMPRKSLVKTVQSKSTLPKISLSKPDLEMKMPPKRQPQMKSNKEISVVAPVDYKVCQLCGESLGGRPQYREHMFLHRVRARSRKSLNEEEVLPQKSNKKRPRESQSSLEAKKMRQDIKQEVDDVSGKELSDGRNIDETMCERPKKELPAPQRYQMRCFYCSRPFKRERELRTHIKFKCKISPKRPLRSLLPQGRSLIDLAREGFGKFYVWFDVLNNEVIDTVEVESDKPPSFKPIGKMIPKCKFCGMKFERVREVRKHLQAVCHKISREHRKSLLDFTSSLEDIDAVEFVNEELTKRMSVHSTSLSSQGETSEFNYFDPSDKDMFTDNDSLRCESCFLSYATEEALLRHRIDCIGDISGDKSISGEKSISGDKSIGKNASSVEDSPSIPGVGGNQSEDLILDECQPHDENADVNSSSSSGILREESLDSSFHIKSEENESLSLSKNICDDSYAENTSNPLPVLLKENDMKEERMNTSVKEGNRNEKSAGNSEIYNVESDDTVNIERSDADSIGNENYSEVLNEDSSSEKNSSVVALNKNSSCETPGDICGLSKSVANTNETLGNCKILPQENDNEKISETEEQLPGDKNALASTENAGENNEVLHENSTTAGNSEILNEDNSSEATADNSEVLTDDCFPGIENIPLSSDFLDEVCESNLKITPTSSGTTTPFEMEDFELDGIKSVEKVAEFDEPTTFQGVNNRKEIDGEKLLVPAVQVLTDSNISASETFEQIAAKADNETSLHLEDSLNPAEKKDGKDAPEYKSFTIDLDSSDTPFDGFLTENCNSGANVSSEADSSFEGFTNQSISHDNLGFRLVECNPTAGDAIDDSSAMKELHINSISANDKNIDAESDNSNLTDIFCDSNENENSDNSQGTDIFEENSAPCKTLENNDTEDNLDSQAAENISPSAPKPGDGMERPTLSESSPQDDVICLENDCADEEDDLNEGSDDGELLLDDGDMNFDMMFETVAVSDKTIS